MDIDVNEWFWDIPPVTRTYLVLCFLLSAACALDFVSLFSLYFNYQLIMKGEVCCDDVVVTVGLSRALRVIA
jgi:hypothetical protein